MSGGPGYCVHNWLKDISGCGRMFQTGSNFGYCSHSLVPSTAITLACFQGEKQAPCHPRGDWMLLGRMTYRSSCAVSIAGRPPCLRFSSVLWNIGRLFYTLPSTEVSDYIFLLFFFLFCFWKTIRSETQKKYLVSSSVSSVMPWCPCTIKQSILLTRWTTYKYSEPLYQHLFCHR